MARFDLVGLSDVLRRPHPGALTALPHSSRKKNFQTSRHARPCYWLNSLMLVCMAEEAGR